MTAAAYLRVSTKDKGQDPLNQLPAIERLARQRGWSLTERYIDHDSGAKNSRAEFQRMMEDARRGKTELLIFWSLDRFSREGILETLEHLRTLARYGVDFLSVQEPMLETVGPAREIIIAILAYFAAFERERHRDRVNAGIERARANGVRFGRRPVPIDDEALAKMKAERWSLREMAAALRVGRSSVHRRMKELGL